MILSSAADLPTEHGSFCVRAVRDENGIEHAIIYKGDLTGTPELPVRIHSECLTGEVFGSLRCDCNEQLGAALDYFEAAGRGLLVYLRQEGRGIGFFNKMEAYALQDGGLDTVEANHHLGLESDARCYELAVKILKELGIHSLQLLTNNPRKIDALSEAGIEVSRRIPIHISPNDHNVSYLETKKLKMEHML